MAAGDNKQRYAPQYTASAKKIADTYSKNGHAAQEYCDLLCAIDYPLDLSLEIDSVRLTRNYRLSTGVEFLNRPTACASLSHWLPASRAFQPPPYDSLNL